MIIQICQIVIMLQFLVTQRITRCYLSFRGVNYLLSLLVYKPDLTWCSFAVVIKAIRN